MSGTSRDLRRTPKQHAGAIETHIAIGNRIPREFFVTKGAGESDITVHAGSFHLALKAAKIETYNVLSYSSILPAIAREVTQPKKIVHGAVAECITAVANTTSGSRATASIIFGWLYDKKTSEKHGGLVCEYNGSLSADEAEAELQESLLELYTNGFSDQFELKDIKTTTQSFVPTKKFGTALVALCFTSYLYPVLQN